MNTIPPAAIAASSKPRGIKSNQMKGRNEELGLVGGKRVSEAGPKVADFGQ